MIYQGIALLLICLLFFCYLWIADSRGTWVITPFLLFAALEIITIWLATIYAYYTGLSRDAYPILVAGLGFASFLMGFVLFRWLRLGQARSPKAFLALPLEVPRSQTKYLIGITLTAIVLLGMGVYLYKDIPPFIKYLLGWAPAETTDFVSESRRLFTKSQWFGGEYRGQGFIRSFMGVGWPFLLSVSIAIYWKTKKKVWTLVSLILFLLSFVFIAGDGTRGPFLFAMISVLIVISMIQQLKIRHLILVVVSFFVITIGISLASGKVIIGVKERNITYSINKVLRRVALGNGINSVYMIEYVRSGILDYGYGEVHRRKVVACLPGVQSEEVPFSYELGILRDAKGKTTYASATYLGVIYADFGLVGVMVVYMMLGCVLGLIQQILYSGQKTPLQLALAASAAFYLGKMSINGFVGFISSYVVVLAVCLMFIIGASLASIFVAHRPAPISKKA